jgi:hypothetical protein
VKVSFHLGDDPVVPKHLFRARDALFGVLALLSPHEQSATEPDDQAQWE